MRMQSPKHWSLFVYPTGMMGEHGSPLLGSRDRLPRVTFSILVQES